MASSSKTDFCANKDKDSSLKKNFDDDDFENVLNAPPPYQLYSSGDLLATSSIINADGTLDINFASSAPAKLDELLPPLPPVSEEASHIPPDTKCPLLNIVIQVVGSRGDVQPFIALGVALQTYGHRVRLATHNVFDKFVQSSGLEFYPVGGDPEDLMSYMVRNPGLLPSLASLKGGDIPRKRRMIAEMLSGFWASCICPDPVSHVPFVADAIIANPPSFAHVHLGQVLGVPVHIMFTMPWTATRAFPHPLANTSAQGVGDSAANYLSYGIVDLMTWQGLGDVINKFRVKELDLEPVPAMVGPDLATSLKTPHTYCWSPAMVAKPRDWGSNIDICGFFMRQEPAYVPPDDLAQFLAIRPMPVYIGFGSIVLEDAKKMTETVVQACKAAKVRVVISRGWSKLGGNDPNTEDVFYLGDCPHEWLFKRVAAVVHHGGAGTTACGLYNARPTVIVPFFGDQPFWGGIVASKGAGPKPIPHKTLNSQNLADAIQYCHTPQAKQAAQCIADQMRRENGVATAVDSFHRHILPLDIRCDILPDFPAEWVYYSKKSKKSIKLSNMALKILIRENKLKISDVKLHHTKTHHIPNKAWDPLSSSALSTLGTATDFTSALGGTFTDPFKAYKRAKETGSGSASLAATGAVGKGFVSMGTTLTKGTLVDVPLALTEGLRNAPKLYGEDVKENDKVTDWKSGGVVAGKNFSIGFYQGVTDIVTKPYRGAKEEGAAGFIKGVGKGSMNMVMKPGSAMFGLLAYPAQGIYKSMRETVHKGAKGKIEQGKRDVLDFCPCTGEEMVVSEWVVGAWQGVVGG